METPRGIIRVCCEIRIFRENLRSMARHRSWCPRDGAGQSALCRGSGAPAISPKPTNSAQKNGNPVNSPRIGSSTTAFRRLDFLSPPENLKDSSRWERYRTVESLMDVLTPRLPHVTIHDCDKLTHFSVVKLAHIELRLVPPTARAAPKRTSQELVDGAPSCAACFACHLPRKMGSELCIFYANAATADLREDLFRYSSPENPASHVEAPSRLGGAFVHGKVKKNRRHIQLPEPAARQFKPEFLVPVDRNFNAINHVG
ncbi:hypothetical protein K402DRAFT_407282 [Aulographum hederae CBS 113979]|uniref:Uncharacterized protein n=1 Tax=Aulographum hederae CBS 113979 TaxID=1176131 RepID=A0A6G1GQB3_9PEZI|nr:hypothetical protein K402DRAFT_407282 [Aulographum hederae CBS 113979]